MSVNTLDDIKLIYRFRAFMYSLYHEERRDVFNVSRGHMEGEYLTDSMSEADLARLEALLVHWDWTKFNADTTGWWLTLITGHVTSGVLMSAIRLWMEGDLFNLRVLDIV